MTIPNAPVGYLGFRSAIDEVADAFGGQIARAAVPRLFTEALYDVIHERTKAWFRPWGDQWTQAEEEDFDLARARVLDALQRPRGDYDMQGEAHGLQIRLRGLEVCAESGGYTLVLIAASQFLRNAPISVAITETGEKILDGRKWPHGFNGPKSVTVQSAEAARKSLCRLAEKFFGVHLGSPVNQATSGPRA